MLAVFTYSEVGGGHRDNEDAFEVRQYPGEEDCLLVALADGQGGQAGGGPAARLAVRSTLDTAAGSPIDSVAASASWPAFLRSADHAVEADSEAGYTTLIGLAVCGDTVVGASFGDSMVLAVSGGRALRLTRTQMNDAPVGSGNAWFMPFEADLVAPWLILVMSDGVWKYVGRERLRDMVSRLRGEALLDAVLAAARLPASGKLQDDFTLIVIQECS